MSIFFNNCECSGQLVHISTSPTKQLSMIPTTFRILQADTVCQPTMVKVCIEIKDLNFVAIINKAATATFIQTIHV